MDFVIKSKLILLLKSFSAGVSLFSTGNNLRVLRRNVMVVAAWDKLG